jgi:hypothetical protein
MVIHQPSAIKAGRRSAAAEAFSGRIVVVISIALMLHGCGKEGAPLPPEIRMAERTNDLTASQEGETAVLKWSYPSLTTAGAPLNDVEFIEVWRATLPLDQEPPPPATAQDRKVQRQLLETQGEVLQALDPAELAAATRGSSLVFRDDLERWRASLDADPQSMVVWYGVRTICCRKRESGLSNVARLLPTSPPDPPEGLSLAAGAQGIDVRWWSDRPRENGGPRSPKIQ